MKTKTLTTVLSFLTAAVVAQSDIVQVCQQGTPGYWECLNKNPDKNGVVGDVTKGDGVFIGGPGVLSGLPKDSTEAPALEPIPPPVVPQTSVDRRLGHKQLHCCQTSGDERVCVDYHFADIAQVGDDIRIVYSSIWAPVRIGSASAPPTMLNTSHAHNPPLVTCFPNGCTADKDMWMSVHLNGAVTAAGYNYAGRFFWECGPTATTNPGSVSAAHP